VFLSLASATAHAGVLAVAIALGFIIGVYGHIIRSRTLIITGIIVIGAVSAYFAISGEITSINH
jgi:hypothetical protein